MPYPRNFFKELNDNVNQLIIASNDQVIWSFYFSGQKLTYATNSVDSFERLERHLRRISYEHKQLDQKVRSQLRIMFAAEVDKGIPPEYQAILWLINENHLSNALAAKLIALMIQEVMETFLCVVETTLLVEYIPQVLPKVICSIEVEKFIEIVDKRLESWRKLAPVILSSYQCPYMISLKLAAKKMPEETAQRLGRMLRGYNFRQLAALLNRDEIALAKQLLPLVQEGILILRDPIPPFNLLPNYYKSDADEEQADIEALSAVFAEETNARTDVIDMLGANQAVKIWKIACIDDSQAMLNEIERLLDRQEFSTFLISDSMKALMRLASIRPDLILLDVGMPNVDGYQLCTMIRKATILKNIPVVMVTGHKGLIDRARARMAGATDYLTKPFSQGDLQNMVMRHLI